MKICSLLLVASALVAGSWAVDSVNGDLSISSWTRNIDLSSQLVKVVNTVKFSNGGSGTVKSVHFTMDDKEAKFVSFIGATSGSSDKTYLRVSETKLAQPKNLPAWKIELKDGLSPGKEVSVEVEILLGKAVEMFPKEITQREKQLALYNGNHYASTPYKVKTQTTKISLPSSNLESYTKTLKPVSQSDSSITYGPYTNVDPFAKEDLSIHFENNNPFLVVSRIEREIELSMWGNIAVTETIDIRHAGAALKGSFSRYEFQRENSGVSSVKQFKTYLPAAASDVYYRDDIGNISTSALRALDDAVELELRPRFPLFGGWKTHYMIGYNVPSYEYLYSKNDHFVLNMRLVDHIYDDMLVEDFHLRIILPEGAKVGKLHTPYPISREGDGLHFTYLDTIGRPVIAISSIGDLTEKHIQDFQLEFDYPKSTMIREPMILIAAFFLFFLLTIIYVRLDFAITKDVGSESRMKVAGICEKVLNHQERRNNSYGQYEDAISKYKTSRDNAAFSSTTKKISSDLKTETQAISDLIPSLKVISADAADKIGDLQKFDRMLRDHLSNQVVLVDKLVGNKLQKPQFIEQESALVKKEVECKDKMAQIISQLRTL